MRKWTALPVAILLVCLLGGCAGLFSLVFQLLALGRLIVQITDFFGHDSTEFTMFFDGYDLGIHPDPDGTLDLDGLPVGRHILTLVSDDGHDGFHVNVTIEAGDPLDLGDITPIQAATISGRVMRQVNGSQVPLAGVRVAAIFGGEDVIKASTGAAVTIPPPDDTVVMMAFTDGDGRYRLGPAQFGDWIVTGAYSGHYADAVLADVANGDDATDVNLLLKPDAAAEAPATVQGTVTADGGGALGSALVAANPATPFAPDVDPARVTELQSDIGAALRAQPWFLWASLATRTSGAGAYTLLLPPGAHNVYGFKYRYQAEATDLTLGAGEAQTADFELSN